MCSFSGLCCPCVKALLIELIFRKRILLEFSHSPDTWTIISVTLSRLVEMGESEAKITTRIHIFTWHKLLISLLIWAGISDPEHCLWIWSKPSTVTVRGWQTWLPLGFSGQKAPWTHQAEPTCTDHPLPHCRVWLSQGQWGLGEGGQPCSDTAPWGSLCCPVQHHTLNTSSPPCTDEGQTPMGKFLLAPGLSEYLFSCFSVFWSVAVVNEIKGEPHSLSLPLPTHINLNANSHRKIKINYAFCSRLHGKWKRTGLAFPFSLFFLFFGSAKEKQCRKILTYASKCCMLACFFFFDSFCLSEFPPLFSVADCFRKNIERVIC